MNVADTIKKILPKLVFAIEPMPDIGCDRVRVTATSWAHFREGITESEIRKQLRSLLLEIAELIILDARDV